MNPSVKIHTPANVVYIDGNLLTVGSRIMYQFAPVNAIPPPIPKNHPAIVLRVLLVCLK